MSQQVFYTNTLAPASFWLDTITVRHTLSSQHFCPMTTELLTITTPLCHIYTFLVIIPALFPGGSGARCDTHMLLNIYTCVYDMQLLAIWRVTLLAVVLLLSLALHVGLSQRLPTSPCLSRFQNNHLERRTILYLQF